MTGRGAANFLTRVTAGLAAAFFATSMLLTLLATRTERAPSVFDAPPTVPAKSAPAVPGPEAPAGQPQPQPAQPSPPRGGVLDKLSPPAPSGPRVPQSQ